MKKILLDPSQFLSFMIDTTRMELSLPAQKIKKIWAKSRQILEAELVAACTLSRLIDKMNATNQVIPPVELTMAPSRADQDYEIHLNLSPDSWEELTWWDTQMIKWNGRTVLATEPDLTKESDASSQVWGVPCQGTSTGAPWSPLEKKWHINCLELLAVALALKTLVKNTKGLSVLVKIDNKTAVATKGELYQRI